MLTYSFTNLRSESLYVHLYNCIKNDILSGKLAPNLRLPSKRSLARNLDISVITVENAYARLIDEGYVYSIPKKGYYVCKTEQNPLSAGTAENIPEASKTEYIADFVSNNIPNELFPFSTWAKIMRSVISEKNTAIMTPPPCNGIIQLRSAIAEYLYEYRGMEVLPGNIVIGAGTEYLYGLIIQLLGRSRIFALENPGYRKIARIYKANGVKYEYINLDSSGVNINELYESSADILHISPAHHFPTGIVTPISRRYELLGWAAKDEHRYIIEDDYDSELRLGGKPIPTLRSIDASDKVIYVNTFTKTLSPSLRISYMVLPDTLAKKYYETLSFYSCTVSAFEQYTLAEFIKKGFFGNHINRMRSYYQNQRDELLHAVKETPALKGAEISEENSGLHFLLRLPTKKSDSELMAEARRRGLNIVCLSLFYNEAPESAQHSIVINYSGTDSQNLPDAMRILGECI